ncbi:hypothetical protein M427DRAFT_155580 [Gonapodya prolifera JEL478]|uniref:Uncharacterized protein n=1 Tax=Gonapodya prolifera (strain JEL478) TaxID=1344416 RepID=A0A139AFI4_GONPJ|nr:hypothetical protein M427DRAFT_155580 [Gonapodya prolifera JEL478]|eukprot:KXS15173.1 hypothetical protein M427DRAFT_155580 [Gonapodya prolifera JEL478]
MTFLPILTFQTHHQHSNPAARFLLPGGAETETVTVTTAPVRTPPAPPERAAPSGHPPPQLMPSPSRTRPPTRRPRGPGPGPGSFRGTAIPIPNRPFPHLCRRHLPHHQHRHPHLHLPYRPQTPYLPLCPTKDGITAATGGRRVAAPTLVQDNFIPSARVRPVFPTYPPSPP